MVEGYEYLKVGFLLFLCFFLSSEIITIVKSTNRNLKGS